MKGAVIKMKYFHADHNMTNNNTKEYEFPFKKILISALV